MNVRESAEVLRDSGTEKQRTLVRLPAMLSLNECHAREYNRAPSNKIAWGRECGTSCTDEGKLLRTPARRTNGSTYFKAATESFH